VPAPILIDVVAVPPPGPELAKALVTSCSSAAGGGGCALTVEDGSPEVRARVVVTFDADYARMRVQATRGANAGRWREVTFRDGDPTVERFRSAGLVVAGLVAEVENAERENGAPPVGALAPSEPEVHPAASRETVELSARARLGWTNIRPWAGVAVGTSIPLSRSRFFLTGTAAYDHTWEAGAQGISEQRLALGAGAGVAVPLVDGHLSARPALELELQDVGAMVRDAATGRTDGGGRFLLGLTGRVDLLVPLGPALGIVGGGELAWLGDSTMVRVHDQVAAIIPAWMYGVSLGLDVRLP
jgi:hypothetical protein